MLLVMPKPSTTEPFDWPWLKKMRERYGKNIAFNKPVSESLALFPKITIDSTLDHEAEQRGGYILIGPKFFKLSSKNKAFVLYHELGHWYRDKFVGLSDIMGWKPGEGFYDLFSAGNSEEGFAEAFAVYFTTPLELKRRYPDAFTKIKEWTKGKESMIHRWVKETNMTEHTIESLIDEVVSGKSPEESIEEFFGSIRRAASAVHKGVSAVKRKVQAAHGAVRRTIKTGQRKFHQVRRKVKRAQIRHAMRVGQKARIKRYRRDTRAAKKATRQLQRGTAKIKRQTARIKQRAQKVAFKSKLASLRRGESMPVNVNSLIEAVMQGKTPSQVITEKVSYHYDPRYRSRLQQASYNSPEVQSMACMERVTEQEEESDFKFLDREFRVTNGKVNAPARAEKDGKVVSGRIQMTLNKSELDTFERELATGHSLMMREVILTAYLPNLGDVDVSAPSYKMAIGIDGDVELSVRKGGREIPFGPYAPAVSFSGIFNYRG